MLLSTFADDPKVAPSWNGTEMIADPSGVLAWTCSWGTQGSANKIHPLTGPSERITEKKLGKLFAVKETKETKHPRPARFR